MKPFVWLLIVFFVAPTLWSVLTSRSRFRKKATVVSDYIRRRGYVLLNPSAANVADATLGEILKSVPEGGWVQGASGITDIELLKDGSDNPALAFVCQLRGREVTIFNFEGNPSLNAPSSSGPRYKVAKVKQEGLPRFSLGRHSAVEKVQNVVDQLVGNPDLSLHQGARPEFFKRHWLRGPDGPAVFAFLSPERLQFLEQENLAGILAANAQYLVYCEDGTMQTEADYDRFIAVVERLIARLL